MFCSNCGTELDVGINFCSNCGRSVSDKPGNGTPSVASNGNMRYRHGFTSFWLWSQLIFSIILFLVFALGDADWIAAYFDLSGSGRGIIIISMVAYALAEILMIRWRRLGFYIWAAVPVALAFLDPFGQGFILNLISAGIGIGIFFAILRIRNKHNGKSTWEQMGDGTVPTAMSEHRNEMNSGDLKALLELYSSQGEYGKQNMRKKYPHINFDEMA